MQLKKAIAAGALGALMAGSTLAFAASLSDFPAPFVQTGTPNFLVVVGATAQVSDVVGAIDVAARLGGAPVTTTTTTCPGSTAGTSVSGEGRAASTTSTKIYLDDDMGKSGLRTTMTADDLPTVLAAGTLADADASTSHKYKQYIYLTPVATGGTAANYDVQFDRPSSWAASADGAYNIARFPTSPGTTDYFYKTYVTFDIAVNGTTAVGEKMTLFGSEYTIGSSTDLITNKQLVLLGGSVTKSMFGAETATVNVDGTTYTVELVGVTSTPAVSIRVNGGTIESINSGSSKKVAGLNIYVSSAAQLSSTDQTKNYANLLLGSREIYLKNNSKVLTGNSGDTPLDGTFVELGLSSNKMTSITVYSGGSSSTNDFLKVGGEYTDPAWKTFSIAFPSTTPGLTEGNLIEVKNSGDNNEQFTWMNSNSQTATVNFAYKATSAGTTFTLADANGNTIHTKENATVSRDQYIILSAGDFPHMFKVTGVSLDGSSSTYIDLQDVFAGTTTRISPSTDNVEAAVIDGQTYYFTNRSTTTFAVTWGNNSADNNIGTHYTVWPTLKGKNGEYLALTTQNTEIQSVFNNSVIELPTGAVKIGTVSAANDTFTAVANEAGVTGVVSNSTNTLNITAGSGSALVAVGKTATGPTYYNITSLGANKVNVSLMGSASTSTLTQPALLLVEEKDSNNDIYSVVIPVTTETSGSNYLAKVSTPDFTATEDVQARGSNSNINDYVDLYGVYGIIDTTGQDSLKLYYPDEQRTMNLYVLKAGSTIATSGTVSSSTVTSQTVTPITAPVAKLDTEVPATSADRTGKNLVLVGGPCVNTLVADLATAGKFDYTCAAWPGRNFGLLKVVDDAFATGKVALVVAGTRAADTRAAAQKLQSGVGLTGTSLEVTA